MTRLTTILTTALAVLVLAVSAFAKDVVVLKSGKQYEGSIIEKTDDIIRMKVNIGGIESVVTIWADDVKSVQRDVDAQKTEEGKPDQKSGERVVAVSKDSGDQTTDKTSRTDLANKKVFVIPMHGGVGETFRQDKLEECIDAARPFNPDVIILEIDSPGGSLAEVYKLRDYLQKERDEFRIVAWIKSAISAAAMTAMNCREMYFMKEGHIGAATAWYMTSGGPKAMEGKELEKWLADVRDFVSLAGYSPYVGQAMVEKEYGLSADVEELSTGERRVTWYPDSTTGEHMVCKEGDILTLTASQAEFFNLSLGTVDDTQEFAKMLNLSGWVEVSDAGRKIMEAWQNAYDRSQIEIPRLYREYANGASNIDDRIRVVRTLLDWVRKYPALVEFYAMPDGSGEQLTERGLERLMRQLIRAKG